MEEKPNNALKGLSLYSHLLQKPKDAGVISSAPHFYSEEELKEQAEKKKHENVPKIPGFVPSSIGQQRGGRGGQRGAPRGRGGFKRANFPNSQAPATSSSPNSASVPPAGKFTADDFRSTELDDAEYVGSSSRKWKDNKKKKKNQGTVVEIDWRESYDPSRPTNYRAFRNSEARYGGNYKWKDYLHLLKKRKFSHYEGEDSKAEAVTDRNPLFAPPPAYDSSSAPSATPPATRVSEAQTGEDAFAQRARLSQAAAQTGEDAFAQRARLTQAEAQQEPTRPPPTISTAPVSEQEPTRPAPTISAAPVFYQNPRNDIPSNDDREEPSDFGTKNAREAKRPKMSFGERMLAKQGHVKGTGLGKEASGILDPIQHLANKKGSMTAGLGSGLAKSKMIGGTKAETDEGEGLFGATSNVIIVRGMVDREELEKEMYSNEPGVREKLGQEFERFGMIERLFVNEGSRDEQLPVFVKYTSELMALRAINTINDSEYTYDGRKASARFYDSDKFIGGIYE